MNAIKLKRSCLSEGAKGMLTPELTPCLRAHTFSLRARIAYADAYAGLRTPDGLSKCLFPVLLINRNSMRAASCLPLKNMTYLDEVKTWKFFVTFGNLSKTTGIG